MNKKQNLLMKILHYRFGTLICAMVGFSKLADLGNVLVNTTFVNCYVSLKFSKFKKYKHFHCRPSSQ